MKNITVLQSVWRRIRRPSGATLAALQEYHESKLPPTVSRGRFLSNREIEKYSLQNAALLYVLDSHENSLSFLSPSALDFVRRALAPAGAGNSRPNIAA